MSRAYYNEFCPKTAAWLRELIKAGLIADGDVDERSITEVQPSDLTPYAQCHFFAGIGGWSYALRLAGVPDGFPVWTGSCPCQPFSAAGKGLAERDERHLWPVFRELIRACNPSVVFGEQVASKSALGWLDSVFDEMESSGYSCAASDLCAPSVGADHIRQRLYWVAHTERNQQPREESRRRSLGRVGRLIQSVPWNEPWESALSRFRAVGDGLPRLVAATDGARNAIVPQLAAEFISASLEAIHDLKAA